MSQDGHMVPWKVLELLLIDTRVMFDQFDLFIISIVNISLQHS